MVFPQPGKVGTEAKKVYTKKYPYQLDGLVYTPINKPYFVSPLKWKPQEHCTIDFLIKIINKTKNKVKLCLFIVIAQKELNKYNYKISPTLRKMFNITDEMKFIPYPFMPNGIKNVCTTELNLKKNMYDNIPILDDTIVEFKYNFENKERTPWIPIRFREDKQKIYEEEKKKNSFRGMNGIRAALSTWNCIEHPITEEMVFSNTPPKKNLVANNSYFKKNVNQEILNADKNMKKFHHHIKKQFYSKYLKPGNNVLELAAGRGGDIHKLKSANFVLFIDIINDNLIQLKERLNSSKNIKYNRNFIQNNAGKDLTKLIKKSLDSFNKVSFDLISIQFALHYFFKTERTFKNLFKNVDTYLKKGGYFMASFFDGSKVEKLLSKDKEVILSKNNKNLFIIKKKYIKKRTFGQKIIVTTETIGEHEEYLVDTEYLIKFMENNGYKLIERIDFQDVPFNRKLSNAEKKFSFLNIFVVFQKIRS